MIKIGAIIPHRSNVSGLVESVRCVDHLPLLVVLDGVSRPTQLASSVPTIRCPAQGFSGAVNHGLAAMQLKGFQYVLILNDDARIDKSSIDKMLAAIGDDIGAIAPRLEQDNRSFYGFSVSRFGRIRPLRKPGECNALSGACLLLPSWARFDPAYPHGIEDIALCLRLHSLGLKSICVQDAVCHHDGAQTLKDDDPRRQLASVYGQFRLFKGREWTVILFNCLQILREGGNANRYKAVFQAYRHHKDGRKPTIII